jgi:hypothetical protein
MLRIGVSDVVKIYGGIVNRDDELTKLISVCGFLGSPCYVLNTFLIRDEQLGITGNVEVVPCDIHCLGLGEPERPWMTKIGGTPFCRTSAIGRMEQVELHIHFWLSSIFPAPKTYSPSCRENCCWSSRKILQLHMEASMSLHLSGRISRTLRQVMQPVFLLFEC